MASGRVIELKKFHANYLIPFHIVRNSLYCTDFTNEFTDISGGDAWAPVYEERGRGFSLVIPRSEAGLNLLKEMQQDGWLELSPVIGKRVHRYAFPWIRFQKTGLIYQDQVSQDVVQTGSRLWV